MDKLKIIFVGNGAFGVPTLKKLYNLGHNVQVITNPAKKVRGKFIETPVFEAAKQLNVPIGTRYQINDYDMTLLMLKPDLIIVASYGYIVEQKILDIPKYGCYNIHASLLPKYRGASCIQSAIANLETHSGVTFIKMDSGLDSGNIIYQHPLLISNKDTFTDMYGQLAKFASFSTETFLNKVITGFQGVEQNPNDATYCKKLTKEDGLIDFNEHAKIIEAKIRAYNEFPGSYFYLPDNTTSIKIIEAEWYGITINNIEIGEMLISNKRLYINCGNKTCLRIDKLQLSGAKIMSDKDFINGYKRYIKYVIY